MTYLYSPVERLKQFYSLIKFLITLGFSIESSIEQGKTTTHIELESLNISIRVTDKGDLSISVPRGLILNASLILLDTDGIDRLPYVEEVLTNQDSNKQGNYIRHPEEEEIGEAGLGEKELSDLLESLKVLEEYEASSQIRG